MAIGSRRNRYTFALVLVLVLLLIADLCLESVGRLIPELQRDPEVWGTYGDWASAIVPAIAIVASIELWHQDRTRNRRVEGHPQLQLITLLRRDDDLTLANATQLDLTNISSPGEPLLAERLPSGRSLHVDSPTIRFTVGFTTFSISEGGRPVPLDDD